MKKKRMRVIALILSFIMVIASMNISFAGDRRIPITEDGEITSDEDISDEDTEDNSIPYTDENISGGSIYFDEAAGTITGIDSEVTNAVIPSKINGIDVVAIGKGAFANSNITDIIIPESVVSIGVGAFELCHITDITIPESVVSIGEGAFRNVTTLRK